VATFEINAELIAAVEQVVEVKGWAGATTELIAEAAGVNRVTLYRRGLSKDRLLAAAAAAAAAEFQTAALKALTNQDTARHRLELLLAILYDLADAHLALLAGLYDGPTALFHLGGKSDAAALTRFEYTEPFERILRDGSADHSLVSAHPHDDAELIFNTAGWTYIHFRRSHRWKPRRARTAVNRIAVAYVTP
jgi:AcrR family transcriptional regulator